MGDQHKLDFTSTASGVRELSETPETLETTSAELGALCSGFRVSYRSVKTTNTVL